MLCGPGNDDNGRMGRAGELVAVLRRTERRSAPSGWALALDAALAVGTAAAAVAEVAQRGTEGAVFKPGLGIVIQTAPVHAAPATLVAAALTALPLALRRLYPITVWLVIVAAIFAMHDDVPPVAFATAVFAAYSAVVHSRYRNLAIAAVLVLTLAATATFADTLPRFPGRLTALFAIVPAVARHPGIATTAPRLRGPAAPCDGGARGRDPARPGS
jgi:hypothetical protein